MPLLQLIINLPVLLLGYAIKTAFFFKIGFGKDYIQGLKEGIRGMKNCKKVPFQLRHLPSYILIELELIKYTFDYAIDWIKRKVLKK